jgi:hypothetical protein
LIVKLNYQGLYFLEASFTKLTKSSHFLGEPEVDSQKAETFETAGSNCEGVFIIFSFVTS